MMLLVRGGDWKLERKTLEILKQKIFNQITEHSLLQHDLTMYQ